MKKHIIKNGKKMTYGYTTGACAAAAAKAAAIYLFTGTAPDQVTLVWETGGSGDLLAEQDGRIHAVFPLQECNADDDSARCAVQKDAGDDPDVTHGMLVYAEVRKRNEPEPHPFDPLHREENRSADPDQEAPSSEAGPAFISSSDSPVGGKKPSVDWDDLPLIPMRWDQAALNENQTEGRVEFTPVSSFPVVTEAAAGGAETIRIFGGEGIGRVTLPGLDQPPGAPAINSGPRRMITEAVQDICRQFGYEGGLDITISIPGGEEVSRRTFNPILGIEGGLSVLGTTGIVEPLSAKAAEDSIRAEVRVRAEQENFLALTPGKIGAAFLRDELCIDPKNIVRFGNFPGAALDEVNGGRVKTVLLSGSLGKLIKLAGGIFYTHSHEADARIDILIRCALRAGASRELLEQLDSCITTDAAVDRMEEDGCSEAVMGEVCRRIMTYLQRRCRKELRLEIILLRNSGGVLSFTEAAFEAAEEGMKR